MCRSTVIGERFWLRRWVAKSAMAWSINLPRGDVRELRIYRNKGTTRLVVYDDDRAVPLIQAKLSAAELLALRKALGGNK